MYLSALKSRMECYIFIILSLSSCSLLEWQGFKFVI